jgi:hypothetical protein
MPEIRRKDDFVSKYANNVQLELSVWDLKFIFGELQQHTGQEVVEQHTSITLPWAQVKLLSLYIQLNLIFHEKTNGRISIPRHLLPAFTVPDEETTDPNVRELAELYCQKVQEFLAES